MPHHGLRTPDGAGSCDEWPAADLGVGEHRQPWSSAEWERTLRRSANELGYALDIVLALPSSAEIARCNVERRKQHAAKLDGLAFEARKAAEEKAGSGVVEQDAKNWLQKLADRSRMRLAQTADDTDKPRMIDRDKVGFVGFGYGTMSAMPFLAADGAGSGRVRAAVLGFAGDAFLGAECLVERTAGGLQLRKVDVPATVPPPPAAAFRARMQDWARKVTVPVHFAASEKDDRATPERCRALFDSLGAGEDGGCRWQLLPGARALTAGELAAQVQWLMLQLASAPPRPRGPPSDKPTARPVVRGAGAAPSVMARPSARAAELELRSNASTEAAEEGGGRVAPAPSARTREAAAATGRHTGAVRSLEERMSAAREEAARERARAGPAYPLVAASGPSAPPSQRTVAALASAARRGPSIADVDDSPALEANNEGGVAGTRSAEVDDNDEESAVDIGDGNDDEEVRGMDDMMAMMDAQRHARGGPNMHKRG